MNVFAIDITNSGQTCSHRAHRVQLERLVALLKRKEDIEGRMSTSIKALERAYLARCAEFKAAIDGRIAELH